MKITTFLILTFVALIGCNSTQTYKPAKLVKVSEEQLIQDAKNHLSPNLEKIVFKNSEGEILALEKVYTMMDPEIFVPDYYKNAEGIVVEAVIRRTTPKDKELIKKLQAAFEEGPDINFVKINCANKKHILNDVYEKDQSMRRSGGIFNPKIDHQNLEIIISLIDNCGLPTLAEVDEKEMSAIWLVLQHAPARYQSKYIPELEAAAERGDIKWEAIALMKDRALMNEGKPQLYGSQVTENKLYDLKEPEYVNQRRAKIDIEPIEDYLKQFGIEFTVKQKTK